MSAVNFAKEFTQLLARWTKPVPSNGEDVNNLTPLTNRQIVNAIQSVVQVMLGVNLQVPDYSSVKTPATGIAICTPSAPIVSKLNLDQSGSLGRFRSLDTLTALSQSNNVNLPESEPLSAKSQEDMDVADSENIETSADEKKFISRSSPAIHVSTVTRSDTFIREEAEKNAANKATNQEENDVLTKNGSASVDELDKIKSQAFLKKMEDLRQCAFDMISKIDDVKKEAYPHSTKPIRRLSSIGVYSGATRSSSLMRPIQAPKLRRSTIGFPGTPTSSKLNTTITAEKQASSSGRKTISTTSNHVKSSKISPTSRTPTNLTLSASNKSPLSSGGRPAKNPKYAHVQSTIPKVLVGKRKAQ